MTGEDRIFIRGIKILLLFELPCFWNLSIFRYRKNNTTFRQVDLLPSSRERDHSVTPDSGRVPPHFHLRRECYRDCWTCPRLENAYRTAHSHPPAWRRAEVNESGVTTWVRSIHGCMWRRLSENGSLLLLPSVAILATTHRTDITTVWHIPLHCLPTQVSLTSRLLLFSRLLPSETWHFIRVTPYIPSITHNALNGAEERGTNSARF